MSCFRACFGTNSNHKKIIIKPCSSNKINTISPQALQDLLEIGENGEASLVAAINPKKKEARHKIVNPINLFEESKDEEAELNKSSRKNLIKTRKNGDDFVSINATKEESKKTEEDDELNRISGRKKVTFDPNVSIYDDSVNCSDMINPSNLQKQYRGEEEEVEEVNELSNSSVSSYISYPPNHRYHCCRNSDDDEVLEDIDLEDDANNSNNDENDDDVDSFGNGFMIREEYSSSNESSLFSLSIDSTRRGNKSNNPMPETCDKEEVNSPLKVLMLNPIRCPSSTSLSKKTGGFGQGDAEIVLVLQDPLRVQGLSKQQEKENIDTNLLDQRLRGETFLKRQENEIAVETSLSSWLVESSQDDDTPNSKNSDGSVGNSPSGRSVKLVDRRILGELEVVEKLKDENISVIGTVGSYLRHTSC